MIKIAKVMFIRDFEDHKAGEVVDVTASQLHYYQFRERACIEVMMSLELLSESAAPKKPKKDKKTA
jgi:mRNA deadenylase 3'-5' endonuclease subunit Ccr4